MTNAGDAPDEFWNVCVFGCVTVKWKPDCPVCEQPVLVVVEVGCVLLSVLKTEGL